ncbi:MAG: hypothetical protein QM778_38255 [Myxococcales bacterium]
MRFLRWLPCILAVLIPGATSFADPPAGSRGKPWEAGAEAQRAPALTADAKLARFTMQAAYRDCVANESEKSSARDISGFEPKPEGKYPVFVYLTGTLMKFNGPEAQLITHEMAKRGFVAAAVDYDNSAYPYCPAMTAKAKCIFDASAKTSALSQLCARAKADCTRGIVVAGFSQGANLAALSGNAHPQVRAAYLMGHGDRALNSIDVSRCADDASTSLAPRALRSVNGEADLFFGGNRAGVRKQLQKVVGAQCPDATRCEQADGSGWVIIENRELADGSADHCYFFNKANTYCSSYDGLDPAWQSGRQPWALAPNLDWLARQVADVPAPVSALK